MVFIKDTRQGLDFSVQFTLQYEIERSIGVDTDGFERSLYFPNTPWLIKQTTYRVIGTEQDWEDKLLEKLTNNQSFATNPTGIFLDSVNPGSKFVLNNEEVFDGTYVESDFRNNAAEPPQQFNIIEVNQGSVSVNGYWVNEGQLANKVILSSNNYGITATRSYTGRSSNLSTGQFTTIANIYGVVTDVSLNNERKINGFTYYDIVEQLSAELATNFII